MGGEFSVRSDHTFPPATGFSPKVLLSQRRVGFLEASVTEEIAVIDLRSGFAALFVGLASTLIPTLAQQTPVAPASTPPEVLVREMEAASAKPLPDIESAGAKLVGAYCAQCHGTPQPLLHTTTEWPGVTQRMHELMGRGWHGIKSPTEQEMKTIVTYMQRHARQ
jgi:cytochrome c5